MQRSAAILFMIVAFLLICYIIAFYFVVTKPRTRNPNVPIRNYTYMFVCGQIGFMTPSVFLFCG